MRLQINDSGAWRNVVDFPAAREDRVRLAAIVLADAGQVKCMRIVDDGITVAYCEKDTSGMYAWVLPC